MDNDRQTTILPTEATEPIHPKRAATRREVEDHLLAQPNPPMALRVARKIKHLGWSKRDSRRHPCE